jgi:tetratricopeptide (TPR) repeat protein/tRNA A-37 threonylcarbamoyl transferase component Bud32
VTTPPPTDPLIGTTVSQYEIVSKLGGGGMGVVYKARDVKLGRSVALKFLPPQWSHDESAKQRFMREAQAASATNHRNICVIHNIEETADGRLFIVMAYYEGETLKQKLERGPLPIIEAIEIASEIADGLAKAHAQGVVHRDVKPGNLIVSEDGVKILDFGLAKFADALQLTVPGSTIGTVGYMSPEQARGEEADARSDVWALGIVMFEMLTGSVPFRGTYQEATFHAIKNEPLPSLRAARPDIPEALERIVLKALEKDPEKRFQNAREPARDLKLLAGRTVPIDLLTIEVPRPDGVGPDSLPKRSVWQGVFTPVRMGIAAALLIMMAAGVYFWTTRPVERIRVAVVPVSNHTGNTELDRYRLALTAALIDEISESPNIKVVPFVRLVEVIRPFMLASGDISSSDAVRAIATQSGAPFLVVPTLVYRDRDSTWLVEVQVRRADTGTIIARYETAPLTSSLSQQTSFRLTAATAETIQQHFKINGPGRSFKPRPASSRFRDPEAARLFVQGLISYDALEYAAARDAFSEAARIDDQHALTHAWLGRVSWILSRKNDAVAAGRRAKTLVTSEASAEDVAFIDAVVAESQGDMDSAEKAYRRLFEQEKDDPWTQAELADFLKRRQDRNQAAIDAYHELLRLDPTYIRPHVDLCQLYTRTDDHPLAESEAHTAIDRSHTRALTHGEAQGLLCLGEAQREQGGTHLVDARRNIEQARALIASLDEPYNRSRATYYQGLVEYSAGRLREASEIFDQAATELRGVGNRVLEGLALMNLGVVNYYLGQPSPALPYYQRGREVFVQVGDERRVAEIDVDVAGLQVDYGINPDETRRTLQNARANLEKLGHVDFQLVAMQNEADSYRYAGRLQQSRTLLQAALEIAKEKQLAGKTAELRLALARTDIQANNYETARTALDDLVTNGADEEARIALGTVLTKLGDFDAAKKHLEQALADLQQHQRFGLLPSAHAALGELAYEMNQASDAAGHFAAAISSWNDPLPNAASIEARCYTGLEQGRRGQQVAFKNLEGAVNESRKTHRVYLETLCRAQLARVQVGARRYGEALASVRPIADDTDDVTLAPELRAQVEFWRGLAESGGSNDHASGRIEKARKQLQQLQAALPPHFRDLFATRADIVAILSPPAVQTHQ